MGCIRVLFLVAIIALLGLAGCKDSRQAVTNSRRVVQKVHLPVFVMDYWKSGFVSRIVTQPLSSMAYNESLGEVTFVWKGETPPKKILGQFCALMGKKSGKIIQSPRFFKKNWFRGFNAAMYSTSAVKCE